VIWLAAPLWLPLLLLNLYAIGIQVERGGWWRLLYPVALIGLVLDVLLAHSLLAVVLWDWPRRAEWTFSQQLKRLVVSVGWRAAIARYVARVLNALAPSGQHVPLH
jgi:hypothetical protein